MIEVDPVAKIWKILFRGYLEKMGFGMENVWPGSMARVLPSKSRATFPAGYKSVPYLSGTGHAR